MIPPVRKSFKYITIMIYSLFPSLENIFHRISVCKFRITTTTKKIDLQKVSWLDSKNRNAFKPSLFVSTFNCQVRCIKFYGNIVLFWDSLHFNSVKNASFPLENNEKNDINTNINNRLRCIKDRIVHHIHFQTKMLNTRRQICKSFT